MSPWLLQKNDIGRYPKLLVSHPRDMDTLRTLEPLHHICRVANLWHWRLAPPPDADGLLLRRSRWLEAYGWSVFVAATCVAAYGLFVEGAEKDPDETTVTSIGHTVDFIQLVSMRVAHLAALLEAVWQRKVQRELFAELGEIERLLAMELHADVDGGRQGLRRQLGRQAVWLLWGYAVSQSLILVAKLLGPGHVFPVYWIYYLLPLLVCGLRYFQIFTAVQTIRWHLDILLQALQQLQEKGVVVGDHGGSCMEAEDLAMKRLVAVRLIYQRVWALVSLVNRGYGISMLLLVGNDFLAITSNCYWIFLSFRQSDASLGDILNILASALWSAPHLGNVLILSLLCDRTTQCGTRLALGLHQITQFSLQLLHQRLHFSASGFFNVDCTLLYTIVGATTTYLIILIQFHMSEGSEAGSGKHD
ncbi:putative gustatory receptor 2a isoform X2 [Drosophila ananassae]|uniref:putative gustatory receptor 2a isoform X2 n=1 Tax=Drosophila ananassae TaxID=7217 RepID=UPI0013A5CBB1|nr:putative gustatory receptor 2a isoform X2 [Drosophila ananassae]